VADAPEKAWLELSVEADLEAVEAVSEILARVAPEGTSIEPGFELVDEGLAARIDPGRPAIVRAYVSAADPALAERLAADVARDLGHLSAFGLRPIGDADRPAVRDPALVATAPSERRRDRPRP
jgi:hypothetical protein